MTDSSVNANTETEHPANGNHSKLRTPLMITVVVLAALLAVFAFVTTMAQPYDRTKTTYSNIIVEEGDTLEDVAGKLEKEGIVRSASEFATIAKLSLTTSFRPGTYYLSPSMNALSIARTMVKGITTSNGFTIPNGYSLEQTATALERDGIANKEAFMEAAADRDLSQFDFIGENSLGSEQVEGFLFPGKYVIDSNADESMLIVTMLNQFSNFFTDDYRARADELELSIRQIVYIASMIETETTVDKEKAAISSVIHNKYNMDMITEDDISGPPLCSPGAESIAAALYPEDNDNIYYVLSPKLDGTHVFTDDEAEYETMKQEYQDALEKREKELAEEKQEENAEKTTAPSEQRGEDQ